MDGDAQALFDRAKLDFDTRRYADAYAGFDQFLMRFPGHRLAAEAAYRRADAFMSLSERKIAPSFWDVMEKYQYALDRFPDSDQAPWALLMMGKASALFGEPFRAQGYFDLVTQDYPQSQYASLAMVERGQTFLAEQDYNRALEEYRRIVERYPDSRYRKDAEWGMVQAYFGLSAYDRAAALVEQMLARNPRLYLEEPEILYHLGEAQFQLRKYVEARANFLWVLNLKPDIRDNDIILARVGDTYQYEGEYKTAQDVFKQVVNLYPESDGPWWPASAWPNPRKRTASTPGTSSRSRPPPTPSTPTRNWPRNTPTGRWGNWPSSSWGSTITKWASTRKASRPWRSCCRTTPAPPSSARWTTP
jgi:TolA-binding protein